MTVRSRTRSRAAHRPARRERASRCAFPAALAAAAGLDALAVEPERFAPGLDLVISLGGDGTMLHAVQLVYPAPVPILGVNVGMLGYLSELEPDELEPWLPRLLAGEFEVSERMMLAVDVESSGSVRGSWFALNEAVLEKLRAGPPDPARRVDQRHRVHDVRGRRRDRRDADRQDRVLVLGAAARSCRPTCGASCSRRSRRTCCSTVRSCCRSTRRSRSS